MITLSEKTVAIWYLRLASDVDWLASITELKENEEYQIDYRFRYYEDDKVFFDSKDRKNWYLGKVVGTKHFTLESFKCVVRNFKLISAYPESLFELVNDGDFKEFIKKLQDAPFAHFKIATPEEREKLGL